jgi:hypothetical protein
MKFKNITHKEESLLKEYIQNGITITGDIIKELNKIGINRSAAFIIKHLKRLGIYQYPNMDLVIHNRDKGEREKRQKIAEGRGFGIINNDTRVKAKVECNQCHTTISYKTMLSNGCYQCKLNQKTKTKFEIRDNKNSARIKEYTSRVNILNEFIHSDRYKEYTNWKETPVCKEYHWYKSKYNKGYKNKELDYKIDSINYYVYRSSNVVCPDKTTKGYKICNYCKVSKPIREFKENTCKPCGKEYRRMYQPILTKRLREKYKTDPLFRLNCCVRSYVNGALKGRLKTHRTKEILGIEWFEFKEYIEDRFEDWMSWDNWGIGEGKWALQHIVPRDFAINEMEIYLLNHYQNFVPMCATANGILKNRIVTEQLTEWHNTDKGIQKIIKRNKDSIITESELKKVLPIIVREIDTNKIKQSEQKLTKWFAY